MGIYKHFQGKTKFAIILYFEKLLQYNEVKKTCNEYFCWDNTFLQFIMLSFLLTTIYMIIIQLLKKHTVCLR